MAQQQRTDQNRTRGATPRREDDRASHDPGAYIGRMPERATETIPGGVGRHDTRVSAVGTRPGPVRGTTTADSPPTPEGHREGSNATDDTVREAGQNR